MSEAYTNATRRMEGERIEDDVAQPADCALVQDLLPLYIDNEVSPESHRRIANHIAHCERCAGYLSGARSVRAQLLRDQHTVHAPAAGPSVTQAPQPVVNTGLPKLGRWLLIASAIIGGLILVPFLIPVGIVAAIPIGLFLIGKAIWNRIPRGSGERAASGANRALATAVLSILAALVCGGIILAGTAELLSEGRYDGHNYRAFHSSVQPAFPKISPSPYNEQGEPDRFNVTPQERGNETHVTPQEWGNETYTVRGSPYIQDRLMTILITLAGIVGLILLNQKRGWLPHYATPPRVRQLIRFALVSAGVLAIVFTVQAVLLGTSIGLSVLVASIVLGGLWWLRRKPRII